MAMYSSSSSSNSWMLSLKVVLISTGVLSMAVALKLSVPVVAEFVASEIPSLWSFVLSWLQPPYLYLIINFIIISIVASSKLQHRVDDASPPVPEMIIVPPVTAEAVKISGEVSRTDYAMYSNSSGVVLSGYGYDPNEVPAKISEAQVVVAETFHAPPTPARVAEKEEVVARNGLQRIDSLEFSPFANENEKPPASARFGHRKSVKASPEGRFFFFLFLKEFSEW